MREAKWDFFSTSQLSHIFSRHCDVKFFLALLKTLQRGARESCDENYASTVFNFFLLPLHINSLALPRARFCFHSSLFVFFTTYVIPLCRAFVLVVILRRKRFRKCVIIVFFFEPRFAFHFGFRDSFDDKSCSKKVMDLPCSKSDCTRSNFSFYI